MNRLKVPAMIVRLTIATVAIACVGSMVVAEDPASPIRFNRDIRPILSSYCFQCHGPDDKKRDGDLRLDVREGATADRDGTPAIVPGAPERSELWRRITSTDPDTRMPPPAAKKPPLRPDQIELLRRWIAEGAPFEGHWAFLPLADERPPEVQDSAWPREPIDRFVLARQEAARIRPSSEADRATLLRRLYLDLLGIVPSPDEIGEFVADTQPDAYERLVERLLASPHHGERWGRHWLDHARYADSHGYTIDGERTQWPFRDWVIRALNRDMPFDQFTLEQLAGDLLPAPSKDQLVASAFHRNTLINQEGGTDAEQFRNEAVVDRVNTTGAVWLGLTIGCAQCHSHKFDPITQREYYQLFAFFNQGEDVNNKGASIKVARGEMFGTPLIDLSSAGPAAQLASRQAAWEKQELERLRASEATASPTENKPAPPSSPAKVEWMPAQLEQFDTTSGAKLTLLDDHSLLADLRVAENDAYRIVAKSPLKSIAALRLRVLTHESLPKTGPGTASNGNFVLSELTVELDGQPVPLAGAIADHAQPNFPAAAAIDGKPDTGWAINVAAGSKAKMNANHEVVFVLAKPLELGDRSLVVRLKHDTNKGYLVGRFDLATSAGAPEIPREASAELLETVLAIPAAKRSEPQRKRVQGAFFAADREAERLSAEVARRDSAGDVADIMVMKDRAAPRPTFLLTRGDFLRPARELGPVAPGVPHAIEAAHETTLPSFQNRQDLARWLTQADNPLTPRVAVNRVWMRYFGRGLVETDEDFGTQGAPPSHPELLDWLGREWIRRGWSYKELHRQIVSSATYRQASRMRPDLTAADPLNLLLARQARIRVEGEIVRDAALAASGLLARVVGGPSVKPPQPDGVYAFTQSSKNWKAAQGADRFRRGMYTFFYRSAPYPLLTTFDSPDFQTTCTRRTRSNTPLQSLTLANDQAFLELAQGLALRAMRETESPSGTAVDLDTARLRFVFLAALGREANEREQEILARFHAEQRAALQADPGALDALRPRDAAAADALESAALTAVARAILNTDAFITRE